MSLGTLRSMLALASEHLGDMLWSTLADARVNCETIEASGHSQGYAPRECAIGPSQARAKPESERWAPALGHRARR